MRPGGGSETHCPPPLRVLCTQAFGQGLRSLPTFYFRVRTWAEWLKLLSWVSSFS